MFWSLTKTFLLRVVFMAQRKIPVDSAVDHSHPYFDPFQGRYIIFHPTSPYFDPFQGQHWDARDRDRRRTSNSQSERRALAASSPQPIWAVGAGDCIFRRGAGICSPSKISSLATLGRNRRSRLSECERNDKVKVCPSAEQLRRKTPQSRTSCTVNG